MDQQPAQGQQAAVGIDPFEVGAALELMLRFTQHTLLLMLQFTKTRFSAAPHTVFFLLASYAGHALPSLCRAHGRKDHAVAQGCA